MLKRKTVFIMGAGASMDFHFPSGYGLLKLIRSQCVGAKKGIYDHLAPSGCKITNFIELGDLIERVHFRSIDALVEAYPDFTKEAKYLIAYCLMPFEKEELFTLETDPGNWMLYLFEHMQGKTLEEFATNPVAFVTFNYDRNLDYFMRRYLLGRYPKEADNVEQAMKQIPIIHVHGQLGTLDEVQYGAFKSRQYTQLASVAARGLIILHEAETDSNKFAEARQAITAATQVGILGFGYLPANMARLKLNETLRKKSVYGTCWEMFPPECRHILELIADPAKQFDPNYSPLLNCNCLDFLRKTYLIH